MRLLLPSAIVIICIAVCSLSAESEREDSIPDFSGKILLVYTTPEPRFPAWIMAEPRLKQVGDRLFLSGKYANTRRKEDWRTGIETHIAWDVVTTYQVLTNEDYDKFLDDAMAGGR